MYLIERVILLNNEVVSLIHRKEFQRALQMSSCSMAELQALSVLGYKEQLNCSHQEENNEIDKLILKTKISRDSYDDDDASNGYIYDHGICLPLNTEDQTVITSVLIFNAALCHHLISLHHCGDDIALSHKMMNKAKGLYELAYRNQEDSLNTIFKLTIVNNAVWIHRRLGSEDKERDCLDFLLSSMMFLHDIGCTEELNHIQGFWMNIYSDSKTASAA